MGWTYLAQGKEQRLDTVNGGNDDFDFIKVAELFSMRLTFSLSRSTICSAAIHISITLKHILVPLNITEHCKECNHPLYRNNCD